MSPVSTRYKTLQLLCAILTAVDGGGGGGSSVNVIGFNGVAPAVGAGVINTGTLRITLAAATTVGLAAGSALVGVVGIDQTTPGTTNGVQLKAGTAIAGKVGIDQTTPGTTNLVAAGLIAGSAIVGKVGIDQTTPGTTNLVAAGLVAGTAIAGKFGIDQTTDGTTNAVHLVAGTALAGKVGIDQTTVGTTNGTTEVAATIGGYTPGRVSGGLGTTVTAIKSSAQGRLSKFVVGNPNSTNAWLQVFNVATAGAVTLGTTVPTQSYFIPPFSGMALRFDDDYSAGMQIAATTTEAGSSALTTNLTVNYSFK